MKRNNITQLILIVILALLTACEDALNTKPLDKFSGDLVWADANTARSFVNDTYGILGMMIQDDDWSDNMVLNPSQSFASNLVQENFTNETNFS